MEKTLDAAAHMARTVLGREPTMEEASAMAQEVTRDALWIAPHPYGRDGGMFDLEPSRFYGLLKSELAR